MRHFSPADNGSYYVEPYTLIGHEAADVMAWASEHPEYQGAIEFERWDFEGSVDVREFFYDPDDEDVVALVTSPANTAAGAVNLLTAVKERTLT